MPNMGILSRFSHFGAKAIDYGRFAQAFHLTHNDPVCRFLEERERCGNNADHFYSILSNVINLLDFGFLFWS